jgi:pimeloyl-ACP methyl ester carboxylesterase
MAIDGGQPWHARPVAVRSMVVRGGALVVDDPGPGGAPLVWAHGLTSSRRHEDTTALFRWGAMGGMRVIRYDARGHGDSPGTGDPADQTWPVLAADLLALMDGLGLRRSAIGGASMGCATALFATLAAPERVDRLVLVIPPTAWETRAAQRDAYLGAARLVEEQGAGAMADAQRQQPPVGAFGADGERRRDEGLERFADLDGALLATVLRGAASSDLPPIGELQRLRQPALVLAWSGDGGHPVSTAERLADVLPAAELHVADDLAAIGRWPQLVRDFVTA